MAGITVAVRAILSTDSPIGFILGVDFLEANIASIDLEHTVLKLKESGQAIPFKKQKVDDISLFALNVQESVAWKITTDMMILPGRTVTPVISPVSGEPGNNMVFDKVEILNQGKAVMNNALDVVCELVWRNEQTGEYRVTMVNKSHFVIYIDAGTCVLSSDSIT
jgi:hypothetical protein